MKHRALPPFPCCRSCNPSWVLPAIHTGRPAKGDNDRSAAIAERSGMTHQLISYHFQSKETLWQAVAAHVYESLQRAREELIGQERSGTPLEQLRQEFNAYFHFTIVHPHLHRFMLQRREESPDGERQGQGHGSP